MHYGTALRLYTNDGSEQHTPCNGIRLPALSPLVGCLLSTQCTLHYPLRLHSTPEAHQYTPLTALPLRYSPIQSIEFYELVRI
jgi:hypothetical protein